MMNSRTMFALLALLTTVGTLTVSTAYAEDTDDDGYMKDPNLPKACVGCTMEDVREAADEMLRVDLPISVWTDETDYSHSDTITITGQVANTISGFPVTITVVNPLNSIVTIDQINLLDDGFFETTINTAGTIWKYDGTYIIKANYGSVEDNAKVKLTGGVAYTPPSLAQPSTQCGDNEFEASGECIPFTISGGTITSATIDVENKSIVINIDAHDDGVLTISPSETVIDGIYFVLVDGEQWDDAEIVANEVTVMFPAGTSQIEVIGTYVIPEFGAIAAMILAVAIVSIIAISARSRLSIMPRY